MSASKDMFNNARYVTQKVTGSVPGYIQNLLWYLVEIMEVSKKDYLQVFELIKTTQDGKSFQKILHKQEQPKYMKEHIIPIKSPVTARIYVIDDGTHSTMLLADEY
ncbi:MAG: DUF960 family protein [Bacillota bacterium]